MIGRPSVGDITQIVDNIESSDTTKTTGNITLYVRTTGNDSNNGLTAGAAVLTIQEAIDRIPEFIGHTVVIDVGEGTFGGFTLGARIYTAETASLTIQGVTALATGLASSTASGTSTGGSTSTLVDAGQSWTVNDLRGRMALVDDEYKIIYSNDATTLNFVGPFAATCSGKAYQIVEQKTILNDLGGTESVILVTGQNARNEIPAWTIRDIKVTTPVGTSYVGIKCTTTCVGSFYRIAVISQASQTGILWRGIQGQIVYSSNIFVSGGATGWLISNAGVMSSTNTIEGVFCLNTTTAGLNTTYIEQTTVRYYYANNCVIGLTATSVRLVQLLNFTMQSCSTAGISLTSCVSGTFTGTVGVLIDSCGLGIQCQGLQRLNLGTSCVIQNSTSHGISVVDHTNSQFGATCVYIASTKILSNGGSGIYAKGPAVINLYSLSTAGGTGNTRFGIELEDGAKAFVRSGIISNPLTGVMGDATVTDAKAALTWAASFGVNLNTVVDASGIGTAIKRRD